MADERRPWRWWQKVLAYVIMSLLAAGAVWLVDRRVPRMPEHDQPSGASEAWSAG